MAQQYSAYTPRVETNIKSDNYDLIRKAGMYELKGNCLPANSSPGPFESLTHAFHELGIQTNILVSGRYLQQHTEPPYLHPPKLFKALAGVIHEHPALSIVGVQLPSSKKVGNTRLWEARVPALDLADCVQFVNSDSSIDDDVALERIFESSHNQKFDTQDTTKPWWRLTVLNNAHVIFVYHHSIGDGISGYAFHRSLLKHLNACESSLATQTGEAFSIVKSSRTAPPPCPMFEIEDKLSWLYVIYGFLFWFTLRLFVNQRYFLFSDAVYLKTIPTITKPFSPEERTITKCLTLRINKEVMRSCLAACHVHQTSFTALLHTLIQATLAKDFYPAARLGFSRIAVNTRPLLKPNFGPDSFTNAASNYCRVHHLQRYRAAAAGGYQESSPHDRAAGEVSSAEAGIRKDLVWKLAQEYKAALTDFTWKSRHVLQDFLTGKLLGDDLEDFGSFYGLGLYHNNSFLISNLGVFEIAKNQDMGTVTGSGGWSVTDVAFSAGATRAALGDIGIVFNVASVKDGDCMICATYEEGVLRDEMVRSVLGAVLTRLKLAA